MPCVNRSQRRGLLILGLATLLIGVLSLSCSKKSVDPPDSIPPLNSTGVLLSGDPNSTAVSATIDIPTVIPEPYQILDTTGLFANRLFVVLSPTAKIGPVNAMLDSLSAKIISMSDASLFLTLSIPAVTDSSQVTAICQRLRTSGLFLFAFPTHSAQPPPDEPETSELSPKVVPGDPALANMSHLKLCSMPAAWNAKEYAAFVGHKVSVLVPDAYVQLRPSLEISSQVFVSYPGDGEDVRVIRGEALGNHGFHVCGTIGANYDDIGSTGIHPGPTSILEIRSLNVGGEEWGRKLQLIKDAIPDIGTSVVSTSMGYNDPFFRTVDKWQRVLLALKWRELVGELQAKFLHATSAGNDARRTNGPGSLAVFNSPFTMAAQMNSPWDWLGQGEYTLADSLSYVALVDHYMSTKPWIVQPLTNVVVVGSSTRTGARSAFSNLGADVRMKGEGVFGPCIQSDVNCFDNFAVLTGTSQATPQIAGLAAFLKNLQPTIDVATLKSTITSAYDNSAGFVNAYRAVLSLDNGLNDARIRKAILDVDGSNGIPGPNPVFDENDIRVYLGLFDPSTGARDYSTWDLNGDGYTGGTRTAAFDLTADNPPAYTNVSVNVCGTDRVFNENSLTDLDILLYYSFSSLFTGVESVRNSFLECADSSTTSYQLALSSTSYFIVNLLPQMLTVNVQAFSDQGSGSVDGALIQIAANGAVLDSSGGLTNVEGNFITGFESNADFEKVEFVVTASVGGVVVITDTLEIPIAAFVGFLGEWTGIGNANMDSCQGFPVFDFSSSVTIANGVFGAVTGTFTYSSELNSLNFISIARRQIVAESMSGGWKTGDLIITKTTGNVCSIGAVYTRVYGCDNVNYSWNFPSMTKTGCTSLTDTQLIGESELRP